MLGNKGADDIIKIVKIKNVKNLKIVNFNYLFRVITKSC